MNKPITITIHVDGKMQVLGTLKRVRKELVNLVSNVSEAAGLQIQTIAKRHCPSHMGSLRQHIHSRHRRHGDVLMVSDVTATKNYAAFVEFGTSRMGKKTFVRKAAALGYRGVVPPEYHYGQRHKFPGYLEEQGFQGKGLGTKRRKVLVPFKGLARWAKLKGLDGFAVAAAIAGWKKGRPPGISAHPFLGPAFAAVSPGFVSKIKMALKKYGV